MANEYNLRKAIIELAKADTGAGGLVPLTGKVLPIVRWGSTPQQKKPAIALIFYDANPRRPTDQPLDVFGWFDIEVDEGAEGLEDTLADRLQVVVTNPALSAKGLDVAVIWGRRRNLTELARGGQRKVVEAKFKFNR